MLMHIAHVGSVMDVHDEIVAASQLLDKDEMLKKYTLHSGLYYHNHAIVVPETADRVKQEIICLHLSL